LGKREQLLRTGGANAAESVAIGPPTTTGPPLGIPPPIDPAQKGVKAARNVVEIPLAKIAADPDQPRQSFDPEKLRELADNLKARGQLQPIRVRWDKRREKYLLIAGERRWRAAQLAELSHLIAVVEVRHLDSAEVILDQISENELREQLAPLELASALGALRDAHGLSTRDIAEQTGLSQSSVARHLALIRLPSLVLDLIESGDLPAATAGELSALEDREAQSDLAARAAGEGLTRDQVREAVRQARQTEPIEVYVSRGDSRKSLSDPPANPARDDVPPHPPDRRPAVEQLESLGLLTPAADRPPIKPLEPVTPELRSLLAERDGDDPMERLKNHPALTGKPTLIDRLESGEVLVEEGTHSIGFAAKHWEVHVEWDPIDNQGPIPALIGALRKLLELYDGAALAADPFPPGTMVRVARAADRLIDARGVVCGRLDPDRPEQITVRFVTVHGDPVACALTADQLERTS
jgi:ParB family chromosome partitioning protein